MDQVACLLAVQNLININAATLVSGLVHQGQARTIKGTAVSVLVAPVAYYFFVVQVRAASSMAVRSANMREPNERCTYDVIVHVADAAFAQMGEDAPYEQMTLDFRRVTDRFVEVLRNTRCFTAPTPNNTHKFSLPYDGPRKVNVTNLDHWWNDAQTGQSVPILYSTIEFQLEEPWAA